MSIQDRDYYRDAEAPRWSIAAFSVKWTLIAVTVVAFLFQSAIENGSPAAGERFLRVHLALSLQGILRGEVWQPLTYLLLHGGLGHLFWNMVALFVFCTVLADHLTPTEQWRLYILGGLAGAAGCLLWTFAGLPGGDVPVVGASGAVTALLAAAVVRAPSAPIGLLFFPVPLWLVGVLFLGKDAVMAVLWILDPSTVGEVAVQAHIGGALAGALAGLRARSARRSARGPGRGSTCPDCGKALAADGASCWGCGWKPAGEPVVPDRAPDPDAVRVDALLERIHASGIGSLSDEEREFLNRVSARYRGKGR